MWWKIIIGVLIVGILGWIGWIVTRPVPGTKMADQGRDHVTVQEVAKFTYNSNPPSSGPHLPTWVKAGIYDSPQSEGELLHSLEHGYVVISYNCNVHLIATSDKREAIRKIYAHEEDGSSSASTEVTADKPSVEFRDPTIATGSATNNTDGCKTLVKNLTELANRKKLWKLAVVPRPQLVTTIALTAWTYVDAFDPSADGLDASRIERFIDYHRDQGPEKTME